MFQKIRKMPRNNYQDIPPQDVETGEFMDSMNYENQILKNKNLELSNALTSSNFSDTDENNLIHYQLETDKILERIEHFLKGDQIKFTEDGSSYFTEPTKNVLVLVKKDIKNKITYYIQEIKERDPEKKTEFLREIVVKIVNKEGEEINILESDSKKILEKIKNLKLENYGYKYVPIIDEDKKPLNEYGVAELMRIISMYITKETFLSYYKEDRINEIMGDLGDALNNFMYCNYEKMGMNTKFKESKYMVLVLNLLHAVESCYRRALEGLEQENLRTRAIVTQSQSNMIGGAGMPRKIPIKQKWNPFKPSTW